MTLAGNFSNADTLTIDNTVTLNGATIDGGTIDDTGTLLVSASSEIENATVNGGGNLTVTAGTLTLSKDTLDGVTLAGNFSNADTLTIDNTVTLNGAPPSTAAPLSTPARCWSAPRAEIENATVSWRRQPDGHGRHVLTLSKDTLDGVTLAGNFSNADTLTIDNTLVLSGSIINGGTIDDTGTLLVSASSEIENATVNGGGNITVSSGTLDAVTLDDVTVAVSGTLLVSGSSEIENASVTSAAATSKVNSGQILTLDTVTLDNVTRCRAA